MTSKWRGTNNSPDPQSDGAAESSPEDLKKTFNNEEQDLLGCKHYIRGCKLQANCCGKWFNCRFCHDDASDHPIVRSETKKMVCMHCQTIQPAAQTCQSCKARMAAYYCDVCKLWDDDSKKHIYHCDDCGICRIGQGLGRDYFHCKKCNVCMSIHLEGNHKCIERNLECDCPICGEYMFTSTSTVIFMPCGHCIHNKCHEDYIKTSYQCPTCWKSLGDMGAYYSKIDSLLAEQTMPAEYANIFSIVLCNDCEVKSEAPYHFLYHKCDKCGGYNTKVLETFKRVTDGQSQVAENATASGAAAAAPENNISGSNNSLAGSSSAAGSSSGGGTVTSVPLPRSPLMDENASGDMDIAGISSNLGP
ncbi:zinc-ribbon-domain-containing protein [Mortierella sp. GBAus27b]|nr:zinc-ribbon-domain-containing protein [Mortierella sp. GBAus27b]